MTQFTLARDWYGTELIDYSNTVVQPKFDGVRVGIAEDFRTVSNKVGRTVETRTVTRSGKFVPNDYIRELLDVLPFGCDGELLLAPTKPGLEQPFSSTMSAVSSHEGAPKFVYKIYDFAPSYLANEPYYARMAELQSYALPSWCEVVKGLPVENETQLNEEVDRLVALGHEGAILRRTDLPHCPIRCTRKYPAILKIKAWAQVEAEIVAVVPEIWHDCATNQRLRPELIGKPKDFASSFECRGLPNTKFDGQLFRAPLTVPDSVAKEYLARAKELIGQVCTVKYLAAGCVDKPRMPNCTGVRYDFDLDIAEPIAN